MITPYIPPQKFICDNSPVEVVPVSEGASGNFQLCTFNVGDLKPGLYQYRYGQIQIFFVVQDFDYSTLPGQDERSYLPVLSVAFNPRLTNIINNVDLGQSDMRVRLLPDFGGSGVLEFWAGVSSTYSNSKFLYYGKF